MDIFDCTPKDTRLETSREGDNQTLEALLIHSTGGSSVTNAILPLNHDVKEGANTHTVFAT